ncbi:hypothetical protein Msil_2901 [Methylocella silvestris BL2]|uniref:Porin n=1 Tax=Methylocella silvestris (strain DSM 15510 / CIP 108128 / LMG 27833 / NCIMB 13906 / BL2) TaxID=395965 RepID=B8ETH5_METSB|nr:hypothetical protein [Methylocella silvestris]ACK51817.1 hypothetical protein Msil_2901 [Methylocella silvestris BL2]
MILLKKGLLFASSVGCSLIALGASARAGDLPSGQAERVAQARCEAEYGPGFSAVANSSTCIWVGGHVRVGFGPRGGSPDNGWANGGGPVRVNAGDGASRPMTGRLRLNEGASAATIAR